MKLLHFQEQDVEMSRQAALLVRAEVRHAETSTVDMLTLDQFTNTEDTPTASVKPTASASVKPTTIPGNWSFIYSFRT